ncbi:MAG: multicopper oxidase family protein [Patescibacteria group bacterium]
MKTNFSYAFAVIGLFAILAGAFFAGRLINQPREIDIASLPGAVETQTVELKDGDTYEMTASYVKMRIGDRDYAMLAYNGSVPGPMLKVSQGSEITLRLKNDTDIETMLHSHGLRLDNASDGTHLVQEAIPPGGEFTYTLTFPDAGLYWYHPHVREDLAQDLGLYGNYLVVPSDEGYWSEVNREVPLFLDDILVDSNGAMVPHGSENANFALMGRYGNVMFINGESNYSLKAQPGETLRLFITNAANVRPFRFAIPGVKLKLVGSDSGAYERETWQEAVTIAPSERAVVEVMFEAAGRYTLENQTPERNTVLGTVLVSGEMAKPSYATEFAKLREHEAVIDEIDALRPFFSGPIDKTLRLSVDMGAEMNAMMQDGSHMMGDGSTMHGGMMMGGSEDGIEWEDTSGMMNAMADSSMVDWKMIDEQTKRENEDIDWQFAVGDKVKIRIVNDENSPHPMQHPIHFHGQRFLVIAKNGLEETNLVWKDTVLIPTGESVDILLDVTNPGEWMAHCHIAEHLEAGMMMPFTVRE